MIRQTESEISFHSANGSWALANSYSRITASFVVMYLVQKIVKPN